MTFEEVLNEAVEMLKRQGRVSYRALRRQFDLEDDYLADLKDEILYTQSNVVEDGERGLSWTDTTEVSSNVPDPLDVSERPPLAYTPQHLTDKILTSRSALEGERKQVTVLFADIKDSTELIRDLDPEDAQKLLDPAIHIMMEAVHRFEGTVNQVLGDGVMSIFGAPIAHEDHAARACYAALAMQSTMGDYTEEVRRNQGLELRIRVGLNSGEVVVRTISSDLHMDYSAVGQTTHLAARMEQLASPGSIRLSSSTLRFVEGLVQVNDLGPIPVKGVSEPVEVYELTGASTVRRRLQAAVTRGLTKFVGREREIDALNQALEQAGRGQGQIVAAVGEAGVGKSRLVYEFVHSHHMQGWLVLESTSVSYGKATPYFPVIDLLKRYVHVEDDDEPRTIRAKVTGQILTLDESLQETIPALLSLLDALPEDSLFLQLDPPQRRQRTLDGLKRILIGESQIQPLLLVFEDLHWIDSETQALLDSLVESLPTTQTLLLVSYRPEYQHGWGSKTYYIQRRLDPLPPVSADEFLADLLGNDPSMEPLRKLLIERTEGNPFFLEESVRTLVETKVLEGEPGGYCLAQDLPAIQVPATVQAVLAARIDRLPQDEKRLLQTAAVIGTEVSFSLLQTIAELSQDALYQGLTHLQATEFLYETTLFPERVYTFKHALTHEVAYEGLLQGQRRILHTRIVETLETLGGDRLVDQVERLAHHALRGEAWDKAVAYFRQAGEKALARSAHHEAVGCFEQALNALAHLRETRDAIEQGIDLRIALRTALLPSSNYERILALLREAEALAVSLDDPRRLGQVTASLSVYFSHIGTHDQAVTSAQHALSLGTASGEVVLQALANQYLGRAYLSQGYYRQAIDCCKQTVALLEGTQRHERFGRANLPDVHSRFSLARCHAELGLFTQGLVHGEEGLRIAEAVAHPGSLSTALFGVGTTYLYQGVLHQAHSLLERSLHISRESNQMLSFNTVAASLGLAYILGGQVASALPLLEEVEQAAAMGNMGYQPAQWLTWLGEAYLLVGRLEDAQLSATRALDFAQSRQERGHEAWTLRLLGNITMHRDSLEIDQAETHYHQCLALAEELSMRPLQSHCHRGLGMVYGQTGQVEQARAKLSVAIGMYQDMQMTFWLPETKTKLAEVGS